MEESIKTEKWVKPEIEELGNAKDLVAAVNLVVLETPNSVYLLLHNL